MGDINLYIKPVFSFFKKNSIYFQYLLIALIILVGVYIRIQPIDNLIDPTTGKYISIELDSTYFLNYAQQITQGGLLVVDIFRSAPLGQTTQFYGTFTSYFVAYIWEAVHVFVSSVTVEYIDVIYPVLAMALMSLFLFLLLRRLVGWKVGLLTALLLNVIPAFLFRSLGGSSDHDILGMMLTILSFYLFFVAYQSKNLKIKLLFGFLCGISTFLTNATFGSGIFVVTIIGLLTLFLFIINKYEKEDFYLYLVWFLSINLFLLISKISIYGFIVSLSTLPMYFAFLVLFIDFILSKKKFVRLDSLKINLPTSIISVIIAIIISCITLILIANFDVLLSNIVKVYEYIFHSFRYSRVGLTVAENRKPYIIDWFSQFGTLYVLLFISGAVVLFYKMVQSAERLRKKLTVSFAVFLILYLFSRYAPNTLLDGETLLSKVLFFGSVIFFVGYFLYNYFNSYYKDKAEYEEFSRFNIGYLFILIWFLVMTIGATTAVRLFNEFAPTTAIMVAVTLVFIFDYLLTVKNNYVKYIGIALIAIILFSPFSFMKGIVIDNYESSFTQAKYSTPGYDQQWQLAGQWVRNNTDKGSIFVHWWDYGYWVQSGFERPTVTDGGHPYGWWDYLIARDVLTAVTFEEPLKFLKAHNVSYLLIVKDEIGKYTAYSSIGGDENNDRVSYVGTFVLNPQASQEKRNATLVSYQGQYVLDEDFVYNGQVYPAGKSAILSVNLLLTNISQTSAGLSFSFEQPVVVLYTKTSAPLPLKLQCIYINDKEYRYDNYDFSGCFRVMPTFNNMQQSNLGAGLFLSKRVYSSLFAKLYLLDHDNPYYELVYNDKNNAPLALYNGNLIGPIKIWKVKYPANLTLTKDDIEYNLRTTYSNEKLMNPDA